MDEQARVRLRSTEKTASSAPRNIVTALTATTPKTPLLVRMPDSRALAGAGATGWALGSQMCSGNMPAFAPKPTSRHTPTV